MTRITMGLVIIVFVKTDVDVLRLSIISSIIQIRTDICIKVMAQEWTEPLASGVKATSMQIM
ncbi:MAG: hypothetical protein GY729_11985 [Desulfobacteraceae bacterium]|nr:hypothetical protein [Desulfobacteraceae bacterium]